MAIAMPASAQTALTSGVKGRVVIDKEFKAKKEWPVDGRRAKASFGASRVRRPAGYGPLEVAMEPAPKLSVILEGAKKEEGATVDNAMVFEGLKFSPGTMLVTGKTSISLTNKHTAPITVRNSAKKELATIAAGATQDVELGNGEHLLSAKEFPFALTEVKVVEKARVLQIRPKDSFFGEVPLESGEYTLAFYHGATPLQVQKVTVPESGYIAIDASISANRVVTVSIKDGKLEAMAQPAKPTPAPRPQNQPQDGE